MEVNRFSTSPRLTPYIMKFPDGTSRVGFKVYASIEIPADCVGKDFEEECVKNLLSQTVIFARDFLDYGIALGGDRIELPEVIDVEKQVSNS